MTPDQIVYLISNAGLAAGLCVFFVYTGAKEKRALAERVTHLENGLHTNLLALLEKTTKEIEASRENREELKTQIGEQTGAIRSAADATNRLVTILENRPCMAAK